MLHPIQPALRAVAASGFRSSMISLTKKVLWDDKEIDDFATPQIIVQQEEIWIVCRRKTFAHGAKCAIKNLCTKFILLAFELVFFLTRRAKEVSNGTVGWKGADTFASAVRAISASADPTLGPRTRTL
jgi:hypothetical protein